MAGMPAGMLKRSEAGLAGRLECIENRDAWRQYKQADSNCKECRDWAGMQVEMCLRAAVADLHWAHD